MGRRIPVIERLDRLSIPVTESGCRLWLGHCTPEGYGSMKIDGTCRSAHRVAYELYKGPIRPGLTLDHLCRVRACVNPDHLEPVSLKENILRGDGLGAINAVKTHCKRGHEFTISNTMIFIRNDGTHSRACLSCYKQIPHRKRSSASSRASQPVSSNQK